MEMQPEEFEEYQRALKIIQNYIQITDGIFEIRRDAEEDRAFRDINPIVLSNLMKSIEITNEKIRSGELNAFNVKMI
jgi:hypothetical protein